MQYSLRTLLLVFVVVWSSMAAFGPWGIVVAAVILAGLVYYHAMKMTMSRLGLSIVCILLLLTLLMTVRSHPEPPRPRPHCANMLKQVGLALCNYHDANGCFPPAYIPDANGKPIHSWRVLILPYMELGRLYDAYDFSEPWNGLNNSKLAVAMPWEFRCPSAKSADANPPPMTSYVAVVGPRTAWPGPKSTSLSDFRDEPHSTLMVVEVANSDINWMEPRDLAFEQVLLSTTGKASLQISGHHKVSGQYFFHDRFGVYAACADGSVRFYPGKPSTDALRAMLTIDGGEEIDVDNIELDPGDTRRVNWSNCVALAVLVLSVGLLLFGGRGRKRLVDGQSSSEETPGKPGR